MRIAIAAAVVSSLLAPVVSHAAGTPDRRIGADAQGDGINVTGAAADSQSVARHPSSAVVQYDRQPDRFCGTNDTAPTTTWCVEGVDSGPVIR
ncbi:hypothetical protein, partial [Actinotalea sp. K2]|uniref:hypothetical protein n=1 Tax=Actinotalea sp. K2 TaxID=2939438 RepID=UPI0020174BC3